LLSLIASFFLPFWNCPAQTRPPLKLEEIMQGNAFVGHQPGTPYWSDDSRTLYFMWNPESGPSDSLYSFDIRSRNLQKVDASTRESLPPRQLVYSRDRNWMVYVQNGDVYLREVKSSRVQRITSTLQTISNVGFTSDEKGITWVADNNVFLWNTVTGTTTQLTDFRSGASRPDGKPSDQEQWLTDQQLELFEYVRLRKEEKELQEKQRTEARNRESNKRPRPIQTGQARVMNQQLCPSGRFVTYSLATAAQNVKSTRIPHFVTESGYTEEQQAYAKVGSAQGVSTMGIYDLVRDTVYQVETADIPGIRDVPVFMREYGFEDETLKGDRELNIMGPAWSEDGRFAVVTIRAQDNKDRWIMLLDPETGKLSLLDRQHDEAWVAGPGISGWRSGGVGWMPDNRRIWFQSEETGYSHLYTLDVVTGQKMALTAGNFEVYGPEPSHDKKRWYFHTNEVHPGERHFYSMPLDGGERTQITRMEGRNDVVVSPDGKMLAVRFSDFTSPWELFVMENKPGASATRITHSTTEAFQSYDWRTPELITFQAEDGADVWARLYTPEPSQHSGAAVIFVHGAGYLQNAHKGWSSYLREYMFHNLLADLGYTVMDIDYRGSAGYGRDWRTGIYRHMGGKDLSDHVDGARYLMEKHGVEPGRIGIYGGSYGGFITLMALFNHPEVFAAGAALRSVTDWAHYNHGYTSNILNTPVTDPEAYRRSSPIYFAEGLQGALLMCHGMIDDNVHFQDIVRLTQRLIELGKENWELAVYPVERHTFTETSSWVDEYKRILKLFEDELR
jgi:dipeptidyl aminopeptidase/acylaminoacyl peptidase